MIILAFMALAEVAGSVTVDVSNVRNDRGRVHVDICPEKIFLKDNCPFSGEARAHAGTVTVVVNGVPAGQYAAQAFHDENDNGEVDRGLFGIPKEGVGFSRDARIALGPPQWRDAMFSHAAQAEVIRFSLRYFRGPSGPPATKK